MKKMPSSVRLEKEALVEVGIAIVPGAQDLESHQPIQRRLQRLVNAAHSALADLLDDLVAIVDHPPEERVDFSSCRLEGRGRRLRRHRAVLQSMQAHPPASPQSETVTQSSVPGQTIISIEGLSG
jgi:hypothetical protein